MISEMYCYYGISYTWSSEILWRNENGVWVESQSSDDRHESCVNFQEDYGDLWGPSQKHNRKWEETWRPYMWVAAFQGLWGKVEILIIPSLIRRPLAVFNLCSLVALRLFLFFHPSLLTDSIPPSPQITHQSEGSGTVFTSTCWRRGSCRTRLIQRPARPTTTPSRYNSIPSLSAHAVGSTDDSLVSWRDTVYCLKPEV